MMLLMLTMLMMMMMIMATTGEMVMRRVHDDEVLLPFLSLAFTNTIMTMTITIIMVESMSRYSVQFRPCAQ
jgi:hypothetical protein